MAEDKFDPIKFFKHLFSQSDKAGAAGGKKSAALSKFLEWMESLDYNQRIKRVIELGKESRSEDEAIAEYASMILLELEKGDFYQRQLSLLSTAGSKDKERIMRFSKDKSKHLRQLANNFAVMICDQEDVLILLEAAKLKKRRQMIKKLRKFKRQEIVDAFLAKLKEQELDDFKTLIYFGSAELVKENIDSVKDRMNMHDAARFSYQHPQICIEFLKEYAKNCSREDPRLFFLLCGSGKWISEFHPEQTLDLFASLLPLFPAGRLPFLTLARIRPEQTVELLSKQPDYGSADFSQILHKLPDNILLQTVANKQFANRAFSIFNRLSLTQRSKVFSICAETWRNTDGAISPFVLEKLPSAERVKEASKHIKLPNLAAKLSERLSYARMLDWDELKQETSESLNSPDPEDRGWGFFHLVYALKFNRDKLSETLEFLHKRKNEPDPVRDKFLSALAYLPPSTFTKESLGALALIIDDAAKAQDLSAACLSSIGRMLLRIFPFHKDWATSQLCKLLKDRGPYMLTVHPCRLLDSDLQFLSPHLKGIVEFWESKERENEICQFARWMQLRLEACEPVIDALCRLARVAKSTYSSETAARLLHDWARKRFDALVPELLELDKSWAQKPLIYDYLSRKRQSWLTPYLGQTAYPGRFATGKTRLVANFVDGFHRWTSKQLEIYANELRLLIEHESSVFSDKFFGILRVCLLPEPDTKLLSKIASLENKDEATRDFAIRQMADTDNSAGLPILLSCLNDERARQAVYALRTAVLSMEAGSAVKLLRGVPRERITIFKELLRLAGDTASKEAFEWLLELEAGELHRDVRTALLRALWNYPEDNKTWEIMRRTIAQGDPAFADVAIRFPTASLSTKSRANLLELYNDALQSKDARTRIKTLWQISAGPILDPQKLLANALKNCLCQAEDECRNASWTIAGLYAGRNMDVLAGFLESIVNSPRNLRTFVQQIQTRFTASAQLEIYTQDARDLYAVMEKYPKTREFAIGLAGSVLPYSEFYQILKTLDAKSKLHFGIMQSACQVLNQSARASRSEDLETIEKQLQQEKSENLRRLGFAALCGLSNSTSGWTEARLARLQIYRIDPSEMVASAAAFTLPSSEIAASV